VPGGPGDQDVLFRFSRAAIPACNSQSCNRWVGKASFTVEASLRLGVS
jgi:hypothetical protein